MAIQAAHQTQQIASLFPGVSPGAKTYRDGTHRLVSPAETFARARRNMPAMGITRIANITGLDRIGIPVFVACRPNSRALAVAQGKGLTEDAARVSALMESIESYHGEHITLPLKYASFEDLSRDHRLVDVDSLPLSKHSLYHPLLPILWIEGFDLLCQENVWLPYEIVSTNFTVPFPTGSGCFQANSNGLASGNHLLEAISSGICEVVERDASALWTLKDHASRRQTRVDLSSVHDPHCRELLEKYQRAGVDVAVWDLTADTGIPAFRCLISEKSDNPFQALHTVYGMGCHPSRSVALVRALTEAAQTRLTVIAGSRDDIFREKYAQSLNPDSVAHRREMMLEPGAPVDFAHGPDFDGETFDADVRWELDRLNSAGIERVLVVDLTRLEFGLSVVKVVIPGLEGLAGELDYAPGARARALMEARG